MEIQDCTTKELIDEIVARRECNLIGRFLEIDDCGFDCSELKDELEGHGYNVSMNDFFDIEDADDDDLKEELESRGFFVSESEPEDESDILRKGRRAGENPAVRAINPMCSIRLFVRSACF